MLANLVFSVLAIGPQLTRNEACMDSCCGMCAPDIHSWTADTWVKGQATPRNTSSIPKSIQGKMLVLSATYHHLQQQIETQVMQLGSREARGGKGGMGSMEGALVTISLLTFAVYLIKLVMMLINAKKGNSLTESLAATAQPAAVQTFVLRPSHH